MTGAPSSHASSPVPAMAALPGTVQTAGASPSGSPRGSKRMRVGSQMCDAHRCKHYSSQWHYGSGANPYTWCHTCYQAARRSDGTGLGLYHPTWDAWKQRLHDQDSTGSSIVLLNKRPDAQALRSIVSLCRASEPWRSEGHVLFLLAFMLQLYWQFPMTTLWTLLHDVKPARVTGKVLGRSLKTVLRIYRAAKVDRGILSAGGAGLPPTSNPSERRPGSVRFRQLLAELPRWRRCAQKLVDLFDSTSKVDLRAALGILGEANMRTYDGRPVYKTHSSTPRAGLCNWTPV